MCITTIIAICFRDIDGTRATFRDVVVSGRVGIFAPLYGALLTASASGELPELEGEIHNATTNAPDTHLCIGSFSGSLVFSGQNAATIVDGSGCAVLP